jgi:hypothetical protein
MNEEKPQFSAFLAHYSDCVKWVLKNKISLEWAK